MSEGPHSVPVQSPADLKKMSLSGLQGLTDDVRQAIVSASLKNGGHLGASLGAVELAIALHYVFESPAEPLVWDVGHQAYAHKLLTGRWDRFHTLRQQGGLSGFLVRGESEHDVFGAGHSSTALSVALALAYARAGTEHWTVAIVGDGGMTAGVALEALNNVRATPMGRLLVVLNDNQMSISPNVGALSQTFAGGRAGEFFDLFGLEYVGPVDGHNLGELIGTLQGIRSRGGTRPILLHAFTQKGKGYAPAEESPAVYHGVGPVQEKVVARKEGEPKRKSCSEAFGQALCDLAARDPKVIAITAAMPEGTGLTEFARRFPDRFFDVGIAEPHAVTFAAGLATQGFKPVVAIYSTFLQRALDAVIHDVALQNLGVTFAIDRAGLVGADGPTHHGMFDLAYFGMVPGMTVSAPTSLQEIRLELEAAVASGRPWAIRYPRGSLPETTETTGGGGLRWVQRCARPQLIVAALGSAAVRAAQAARQVDPQGERIGVLAVTRAKPLEPALVEWLRREDLPMLTVEDGVVRGGFGESLSAESVATRVDVVGYPDRFVPHGSPFALEEGLGLSVAALAGRMREMLSEEAD